MNPRISQNRSAIWRAKNRKAAREIQRRYRNKLRDDPERFAKQYARQQDWRQRNPESIRESKRRCYLKARENPKRRELDSARARDYHLRNPGRKRVLGPTQKIRHSLTNRIRLAVKSLGTVKADTLWKLTGCSPEHFKVWMTFWFQPGMSWKNHGSVWHIDHVMPCARFDLADPDQQRRCFHYTNLQPLFKRENQRKHSRLPDAWIELGS